MENKHKQYLSVSAYKGLLECEARQIAIDLGEFTPEKTPLRLIGSYIDAYFTNDLNKFKEENPQIFKKDGSLYSDFAMAEDIIKFIEQDALLLKYIKGDKLQHEVTGEIGGVPFLGYIDSLHTGKAIVDLKIVADLYKKEWSKKENTYVHFIEAYGYDIQLAVYQQLHFQMTNQYLPVFLAMITKQKPYYDKAVVQIPQGRLDYVLEEVMANAPALLEVRKGNVAPKRCEKCDYCRSTKQLKTTITVFDLM